MRETVPSPVLSPSVAAFPAGFIPPDLLFYFSFDLLSRAAHLPLYGTTLPLAVLIIPDRNGICTRTRPYPRCRCNSDGIVFRFRRTCKIYYPLGGLVLHYDLPFAL